MKNLTKAEINKICNEIIKNGGKPYALVKVSAEMHEKPNDSLDIFYNDTMPQVVEIMYGENEAIQTLAAKGDFSCAEFNSPAGTFYDCTGYIVCGMADEFEEGEDWSINTDEILDDFNEEKAEYNPIKGIRVRLGMTQRELSEACFDIPLRTIQKWENGTRTPPLYLVMLIMARLDQLGKLDG